MNSVLHRTALRETEIGYSCFGNSQLESVPLHCIAKVLVSWWFVQTKGFLAQLLTI